MRFVQRAASVSRTWRTTALNTSALWGTVVITRPRAPPLTVLTTLLERSRGAQLDIFLDLYHTGPRRQNVQRQDGPTYIKDAMQLLRQHIQRWRSLDLTWGMAFQWSDELDYMYGPFLTGTADALKSLHLSCVCRFIHQDDVQRCDFTKGLSAPNLRSLDLDVPSATDLNSSKVTARFPSIQELRWRENCKPRWFHNSMDFMRMLGPLRDLRHLTLDNVEVEDVKNEPLDDDEALVCLPALETLTFCDTNFATIRDMLSIVTAPQLRDLTILNLIHEDETASFHAFWQQPRRFPLLRTLNLEYNVDGLTIEELIDLWHHFQFFRSARIIHTFARDSNDFSMEDVLEVLSNAQEDGRWLFPSLTSVAIYSKSNLATDGLRQLVGNRQETETEVPDIGVTGLQTLKIYAPAMVHSTDSDYFVQNLRHFDWIQGKPPPGCDKQHLSMASWAMQLTVYLRLMR
ncbi:predicted protein [Postia placenta Mad-698-R]|uniref:F-box domain-containing protein n=1 Tax=Postia placenta MAD-698-R-SB12 TaxID=670580 RepID=A0A1X6MQA4_9APHY|nr:hypothetical protein POSPLADRAFT_1152584 [Postia placenta MAD-698-R-SB12]EED77055.1 predicted protein [Postia placenta Mad-698-R]OSX58469.1 hypothetical protein POSPLADRAFT_1152584 [Postia placenta MAD-698-R-SB12]